MEIGHFYFLSENYFVDFPDPYLAKNRELIAGQAHARPCFFAIVEMDSQIQWMIPISSNVNKYQTIYQRKITKYGNCDTLEFGYVLGYKKAFLIQNMFPTTQKYISGEYIDKIAKIPVRVDGAFEKSLIQKAEKVLALNRHGMRVIFPDVFTIENELVNQLNLG